MISVHLHWLPQQRCQWSNGHSLISQPKMAFQVPSEQHCLLLNAALNSLQMKANSPTVLTVKEITSLVFIYNCIICFILLAHNIHDCWKFFSVHSLFLFICPYSKLAAGFTYENQLTDALQDIKHIYDKTPDKSLYVPYLSHKDMGRGRVEKEKRPALGWCHGCWAHLPQIKLPSKGLISQTFLFSLEGDIKQCIPSVCIWGVWKFGITLHSMPARFTSAEPLRWWCCTSYMKNESFLVPWLSCDS